MRFTHWFDHCNGTTTLFALDNCETCGGPIQAANSVGGVIEDVPKYTALGLKQALLLPYEGYYSEEVQQEACYGCNK